ncbi:hypothetical protein KKC13_05285, partial [bacterium]|nr:hypothetical protein [bacterium]
EPEPLRLIFSSVLEELKLVKKKSTIPVVFNKASSTLITVESKLINNKKKAHIFKNLKKNIQKK